MKLIQELVIKGLEFRVFHEDRLYYVDVRKNDSNDTAKALNDWANPYTTSSQAMNDCFRYADIKGSN